MANLLGANIGTNYKGFLNLDSTINTPLDTTLRAVTDGMGNVSPLQLSTDQVGISRTIALTAGSTNPRLFNEVYTINNSGAQTGTLTGIFLNATETALNGITHNLMDLQVGGVSKFKIDRNGATTLGVGSSCSDFAAPLLRVGNVYFGSSFGSIQPSSQGVLRLLDGPETSFNRLQLGGTTSSFPSIKRNGTAIDFRLADDSNYADISSSRINLYTDSNGIYTLFSGGGRITGGGGVLRIKSNGQLDMINIFDNFVGINATSVIASAVLAVNSTTQGFLPPRMTSTQKNAIVSPATGLVVFDTTLNKLAVFTTVWETITSI